MYTVLTEQYANPNAQYPFGQEMRRSVEDWRAVIAKAVGCEANQLFFTSCGTEGDNWAIRAAWGMSMPAAQGRQHFTAWTDLFAIGCASAFRYIRT